MDTVKYILALVGAAVGYLVGDIDGLFIALIIFVVIDYITGVLKAIYLRKLSSEVGAVGILKKICIFILVAVANVIDHYIMKVGGSPCRTSVIFFYLGNEGISILENVAALDVPIPEKLRSILKNIDKDTQ